MNNAADAEYCTKFAFFIVILLSLCFESLVVYVDVVYVVFVLDLFNGSCWARVTL